MGAFRHTLPHPAVSDSSGELVWRSVAASTPWERYRERTAMRRLQSVAHGWRGKLKSYELKQTLKVQNKSDKLAWAHLNSVHCVHIRTLSQPSGSSFIELLSSQICLAWHFFLDKNVVNNQISTWFSGFGKQQLNTSIKQYVTNGNLVGNPFFIKDEISC